MSTIQTSLTVDILQAKVDALKLAYLEGTLEIRFSDGKAQRFQNANDMLKAIETGEDWIRELANQGSTRCSFAQHKRGDGPSGPGRLFDTW
jgi:hypothetical protein